jgi:hypothetical protein
MISREDILAELEKELGDLLADAPANLSELTLKDIKAESIAYAEHVLNALTTQELQIVVAAGDGRSQTTKGAAWSCR